MAGRDGRAGRSTGVFNGKTEHMTVPLNLVICWMFFFFFVTKSVDVLMYI